MIKAILGYDIMPNMSKEEYEKWLREIHIPDLAKIPGLKRVVLNTVIDTIKGNQSFYRISELHFETLESFENAMEWRRKNPISKERSPDGKTGFKFYVLCESEEIDFE